MSLAGGSASVYYNSVLKYLNLSIELLHVEKKPFSGLSFALIAGFIDLVIDYLMIGW